MKKIYFTKLILTCFILFLGYTAFAQQAELMVRYKFDETSGTIAADATGNGYDGTIVGTTNWVEGTLDGAIEFTGDSGLVIPAPILITASDTLTSNSGAVSLWLKCDVPTSIFTLWWGGDNTTGGGFGPENEMHLHLEQAASGIWTGGEASFWVQIGTSDASAGAHIFSDSKAAAGDAPISPVLLGDNAWHHVVANWGNNLVQMYVDGLNVHEAAYVPTNFQLSHMFLGMMANRGRTFIGTMDDFRLYSAPLNAIEVEDLYNKITGVDNPVVNDLTQLVAYPTPAINNLNVRFFADTPCKATVTLTSLTGQVLKTVELNAVADYNYVTFNPSNYSKGVYFVNLEMNGKVSHTKVTF